MTRLFSKKWVHTTLAHSYSLTFSKYSSDPSGLGLMVGEFSLQLAGQTSPCFSTNWKALTSLIVSSTDLPTMKKKNRFTNLVSYKKYQFVCVNQNLGICMCFWGHKKKWAQFSKIICFVYYLADHWLTFASNIPMLKEKKINKWSRIKTLKNKHERDFVL